MMMMVTVTVNGERDEGPMDVLEKCEEEGIVAMHRVWSLSQELDKRKMLAGDRARVGYELRAAVRELSHTYTRCKEYMLKAYDKRISDESPAPTCPPPSPPCPPWPVCDAQESPSDQMHVSNPTEGEDDDKKDTSLETSGTDVHYLDFVFLGLNIIFFLMLIVASAVLWRYSCQ